MRIPGALAVLIAWTVLIVGPAAMAGDGPSSGQGEAAQKPQPLLEPVYVWDPTPVYRFWRKEDGTCGHRIIASVSQRKLRPTRKMGNWFEVRVRRSRRSRQFVTGYIHKKRLLTREECQERYEQAHAYDGGHVINGKLVTDAEYEQWRRGGSGAATKSETKLTKWERWDREVAPDNQNESSSASERPRNTSRQFRITELTRIQANYGAGKSR